MEIKVDWSLSHSHCDITPSFVCRCSSHQDNVCLYSQIEIQALDIFLLTNNLIYFIDYCTLYLQCQPYSAKYFSDWTHAFAWTALNVLIKDFHVISSASSPRRSSVMSCHVVVVALCVNTVTLLIYWSRVQSVTSEAASGCRQ